MPFLIGIVPVIAVRAEAKHSSEQVSQLLFGEIAETIEVHEKFTRIRCLHDNYEGWCQTSQLKEISNEQVLHHTLLASDWSNSIICNGTYMNISYGSSIGFFSTGIGVIDKYHFEYKGAFANPATTIISDANIETIARNFLNTSYLWGGRSVFGVDCSGFTQMVYRFLNIPLLRDASLQATQGDAVGFLEEVKCGDLAFFDNEEGKITHVGLLLDKERIIHASGIVRIDKMDNAGIVHAESGERTHRLRIIKRILETKI